MLFSFVVIVIIITTLNMNMYRFAVRLGHEVRTGTMVSQVATLLGQRRFGRFMDYFLPWRYTFFKKKTTSLRLQDSIKLYRIYLLFDFFSIQIPLRIGRNQPAMARIGFFYFVDTGPGISIKHGKGKPIIYRSFIDHLLYHFSIGVWLPE